MASLLYPIRPAEDQRWFERILPHIDELYITLGIPHQQLIDLKLRYADRPFNPDFRPVHLGTSAYRRRNLELDKLKADIEVGEPNSMIRLAYSLKVDELIAQNDLLIAAINGQSDEVIRLNRWLFGATDPELFGGACAWIRRVAAESLTSTLSPIARAAEATMQLVPDAPHDSIRHIMPNDHTFKHVREAHFQPGGYFDTLLGKTPVPEVVTPAEGDPLTATAIRNVGSTYALQDSTDYLWGVVHQDRCVVRPIGYELSRIGFIGIVSHEIGSHLLERENGLRQALLLLSVGLDRYESSNEGRAFIREQIQFHSPYEMMSEQSWEHIILLYLSSALGDGAHSHPYDFMSLHETVLAVCRLFKSRRMPDNPVMAERQAIEEAWQISTRAAKGTNGTGGAFNKGMVYLSGNMQAWQMATTDPSIIFLGDAGKFDISRPDHRDILDSFDIIRQN